MFFTQAILFASLLQSLNTLMLPINIKLNFEAFFLNQYYIRAREGWFTSGEYKGEY